MRLLVATLCGLLFGAGLAWSEMIRPERVLGFLDVAGDWDPTLAWVMASALVVSLPGFALIRTRSRPLLAARFRLPTSAGINGTLLAGAGIFGVGWGLAGYCPGPALAALSYNPGEALWFVAAMAIGGVIAGREWRDSPADKKPLPDPPAPP